MAMSMLVKRSMIVSAAVAATAALIPTAPAAAASTIACDSGYVCVELLKGPVVAVPEGDSVSFPAGADMAGIVNQTKIGYCVGGSPNFALDSGMEIIRTQTITGFEPGQICLT